MKSDDVDIAVWDCGGRGRTIILLHGLAGSSRELLPTAYALTDRFRVFLVDQRGHGFSSRHPQGVSRRAFTDSLELGAFFRSWPPRFATAEGARDLLGTSPLADAWIADMETTADGLGPRFDPDIMERTIRAVHEPRWDEWESLHVRTVAIFAENGMFTAEQQDELVRRRPEAIRAAISNASHDAHLDAFDEWIAVLRDHLALQD